MRIPGHSSLIDRLSKLLRPLSRYSSLPSSHKSESVAPDPTAYKMPTPCEPTADVEMKQLDVERAEKTKSYDAGIIEEADEETDRQAHIGVTHHLTEEEKKAERKLLRKIDWHILPLLMVTYGLQVCLSFRTNPIPADR